MKLKLAIILVSSNQDSIDTGNIKNEIMAMQFYKFSEDRELLFVSGNLEFSLQIYELIKNNQNNFSKIRMINSVTFEKLSNYNSTLVRGNFIFVKE